MDINDGNTQLDPCAVQSLLSQLKVSNENYFGNFLASFSLDQLLALVATCPANNPNNNMPPIPGNFTIPIAIPPFPSPNLPSAIESQPQLQSSSDQLNDQRTTLISAINSVNLNAIAFPNCNFEAMGRRESVIRSTRSFTLGPIKSPSNGDQITSSYLPTCSPPEIRSKIPAIGGRSSLNGDGFSCGETSSSSYSVDDSNSETTSLESCADKKSSSSSTSSSRHRASYPREFKLIVIDQYFNNGQNKYRTCKEFRITKSMLNGWLQKAEKIRDSRPGSLKSGRSGRRPQFPNIESQLFELLVNHLKRGEKLSNKWIRETAKKLAEDQCTAEELRGMCQFSERWLNNFKKRYHIQSGHQTLNQFD